VDENGNGMADDAPDADSDTFDVCNPGDAGDTDGKLADCMDLNPSVNPGVTEGPSLDPTCSDGLDNDCDGNVDADDSPPCP